ncbi:P-loop containing nucleoside triphosphate hydrolase protein [Mycena vulgaris]|nr:P-loop containing nucleoside triphosphate hydrolase protein [Mycena vulgaris]
MEGSDATVPAFISHPVNSVAWLEALLRQKCGLPSLYPHQLAHGKDLNDGRDLFLVIATGLGKSIVLFAPLIAAQARQERGIAFVIVPTKVLAEQMAEVGRKYGLRALAINEDSVREAATRDKRDLFAEFSGGAGISVGVMSPQMLQGRRMGKLLNDPKFKSLVRWMLIDEAHVLNEESGTSREPYRSILHMRPRLPTTTVWAAVTGTATPKAALSLASGLGFRSGKYVNARYSIDRPNVKYIPRFFEHPTSGFEFMDLSFVVPLEMMSPLEITLTLIFAKTIRLGFMIMQFLDSLIPSTIPHRLQIIKLYNALMPVDYRRAFIADINEGHTLRVGIVTDTCTYGTDIPTLARVIIVHIGDSLGDSPEVRKQQMGRPGRNGDPATAIVYAPAWVRDVPLSESTTKQGLADIERRKQLPAITLQFFNPTLDCCSRGADLQYNGEKFVRRPECCSLHDPDPEESRDLGMVTKWVEFFKLREQEATAEKVKTLRSDGTYPALDTVMKVSLMKILVRWRARKYQSVRDPKDTGGTSALILPQRLLQRIVDRAHACTSLDRLWGVLHDWKYLALFGEDLFEILDNVLPGYAEIIRARAPRTEASTVSDSMDVDPNDPAPEAAKIASGSSQQPSDRMDIDSPAPLKIIIPSRNPVPPTPHTVPAKRPSPPSPYTTQKRSKLPDKENMVPI